MYMSSIFRPLVNVRLLSVFLMGMLVSDRLAAETFVLQPAGSDDAKSFALDSLNRKTNAAILRVGREESTEGVSVLRALLTFNFSKLRNTIGDTSITIKSATLTLSNRGPETESSEIDVQLRLLGDGGRDYEFDRLSLDWGSAPLEAGGSLGEVLSSARAYSRYLDESVFESSPSFVRAVQEAMNSRDALRLIIVADEVDGYAAFSSNYAAKPDADHDPHPKLTIEYVVD